MQIFELVWERCFPPVLPPALAILVLPGIWGCGRSQHPSPSGRPIVTSSEGTSESTPSDNHDDGPHEPKESAISPQTPPSADAFSKDNESAPSPDEGLPGKSEEALGNAQSVPEAEPADLAPSDGSRSPADALKALGATIKMNVKGDVINVDLKETQVTDADLSHLKEMTEVKTLNLSLTPITDEGLASLQRLANLKYLYLFGTDTTDAGLKHLSGLTGIEVLCLDDTRITDAGLTHLKNLTELKKLHIQSKGAITDAGLESLTGLTKLVELRVGGTEVTDEGVNKLKQSLPECQVVW